MATKKITLWYQATKEGLIPPAPAALERKELWLKTILRGIRATWEPMMVEVTYRLVNPEIEQQRKFFEGPVVEYYMIQNDNNLTEEISKERKNIFREELLDQVLGYDVQLVHRAIRRRKSTTDYSDTQQWHDFLEELKETVFEPSGYEMPDSKTFWELSKQVGYDQAKIISIEKLRQRLIAKDAPKSLSTGEKM